MCLYGVGDDEVIGLQRVPGKGVALVNGSKVDDLCLRRVRLWYTQRAVGVLQNGGVESKGRGNYGGGLFAVRREAVHIGAQGHELGDVLPLWRGIGKARQGRERFHLQAARRLFARDK